MNDEILRPGWASQMRPEQWSVYRTVLQRLESRGLPFALGGAFANATYLDTWRDTKDLDIYVLPENKEAVVEILQEADFLDYYSINAYDRAWIYRGIKDGELVDIIWVMANHSAFVDRTWLEAGPQIEVRGEVVRILPAEELIWARLFVLQRERSDWPDVLNMLYSCGASLDFRRLLDRLGEEVPLLAGALAVFAWLAPEKARQFPDWLWAQMGLARPSGSISDETMRRRAALLDSRDWFIGISGEDQLPQE